MYSLSRQYPVFWSQDTHTGYILENHRQKKLKFVAFVWQPLKCGLCSEIWYEVGLIALHPVIMTSSGRCCWAMWRQWICIWTRWHSRCLVTLIRAAAPKGKSGGPGAMPRNDTCLTKTMIIEESRILLPLYGKSPPWPQSGFFKQFRSPLFLHRKSTVTAQKSPPSRPILESW